VGRKPDPFRPTPWRVLRLRDREIVAGNNDSRIGGRFDDPAGQAGIHEARRFRTLYFSSQRSGAIGETIGPRQVSIGRLHYISSEPRLPRGLADVIDDEPPERLTEGLVDRDDPSRGLVRHDWYAARCIGSARLDTRMRIVNLFDGATVQHLRRALASVAIQLGIDDIDYSTIVGPDRRFTQAVANYFYEQIDDAIDQPACDGLYYRSRYNQEWECWALFDRRLELSDTQVAPINIADADFVEAANLLHLSIEGEQGTITQP
jgi:hypothetical protein